MFGKSRFGAKAEPEKPPVKLGDTQFITEIEDAEAFNKFKEAWDLIQSQKNVIKENYPEPNIAELIERPLNTIHNHTLRLLGQDFDQKAIPVPEGANNSFYDVPDILSLANHLDAYKKTVSDYKTDLDTSRLEKTNAQHARAVPTQYIKRVVGKVEQQAIDISEQLSSYESYYQTTEDFDSFESLVDFLKEDYDAVMRTAARVADLSKQRYEVRKLAKEKFNLDENQLQILEANEEQDTSSLVLTQIQNQYKEFEDEQKKANEKTNENTDLFGMSLAPPLPAKKGVFGGLGTKTTPSTGGNTTGTTKPST